MIKPATLLFALLIPAASSAKDPVKLMTLAPGHFHAALVQKSMVPGIAPEVDVYAPEGPELDRHLALIDEFNRRAENPTHWKTQVHKSPDYLAEMLRDKPGNLVVISGNNAKKSRYILECVKAGLNVLSDKPMAIDPEGLALIEEAYRIAGEKKLLLLDIMTERNEITTILQREFSLEAGVFGEIAKGSPSEPSITKESIHHYSKLVNGVPLQRTPWFFDPKQQGEAIVDVTTHLVDLVQWECFPDQIIAPGDVKVISARRSNTPITLDQYRRVTKLDTWPDYLKPLVDTNGILQAPGNGEFIYTLRGIHAKVSVKWAFEPPTGAGDTHDSVLRGTKAILHIRQGAAQGYKPVLLIEPVAAPDDAWRGALEKSVGRISSKFPGIATKETDGRWELQIPDSYKVGHEAHFRQVIERFIGFLEGNQVPKWELPNTLTKYRTIMEAWRTSRNR
jgi:predicted dehydrogenase